MRSTMAMTLFGFGMIFFSFGAVSFVLNRLAARFGTPHGAGLLTMGFLAVGAVLIAAGFFLNRSGRRPTQSGS